MEKKVLKDVVYKTVSGKSLRADVMFPSFRKYEPSPVLFYFHGGAWTGGIKDEPKILPRLMERLAENGVSVISVEYRLCNESVHFPVPLDDCSDAIRFFTARAGEYGIDVSRAFTGGASAGGHLSLMMGFAAGSFGDDRTGPLPSFRCILDMCGPVDLNLNYDVKEKELIPSIYEKFLSPDKSTWPALTAAASPITYARSLPPEKLVPVLAIHGQCDEIVDKDQPEILCRLYEDRGAHFEIIRVENGNHGFGQIPGLPVPSFTLNELQDRAFDFIERYGLPD